MRHILALLLCAGLVDCGPIGDSKTKLVYFGFDDHSEKQQDAIALAKTWGGANPPCAHWRASINKQSADYQVLFGDAEQMTIVDHRGEVLYSGGVVCCTCRTETPTEAA
jgi:hypothetical protein